MKLPLRRRAMLFAAVLLLLPAGMQAQSSCSLATVRDRVPQQRQPHPGSAGQSGIRRGRAGGAGISQQHLAPLALKAEPRAKCCNASARLRTPLTPSPLTLHLIVGRSFFLDSADKLRRVYVSNPTVLDAMTASPYEVVITAKAAGHQQPGVVERQRGSRSCIPCWPMWMLPGCASRWPRRLPGDRVEVEAQEGRIHLTGVVDSDAASDEAAKLAAIYSKDVVNSLVVDPRHLPQVQLQVRIAEIDRSKLTEFGINLFSLGQEQRSGDHRAVQPALLSDTRTARIPPSSATS